ncbi:MAG: ABC transporter permease [Microbacterium sp.]|uniref:ABC transporter permease n=1 Tax=Microbacterium sp. TaxID=51671 RepID=UPI0039E430B4
MSSTAPPPVTETVVVVTKTPLATRILENYALLLIAVAVAVFFALYPGTSEQFLTVRSLNTILTNMLSALMIALAALFPFIAGYMDFSVGATAALTCVFAARLMDTTEKGFGWPVWAAVLVPVLLAPLVGLANGFFVTRLQMNPFVTTLGMSLLLAGVAIFWSGGLTFSGGLISSFATTKLVGLPVPVFAVLGVALLVWYVLTHTPFGRSLYGMGSSTASARLVGIRVDRNLWWAFVVASLLAALGGVLQLAQVGSATASDGGALLFKAITFVFLGATAITPGFFNVFGTIIAAILLSISVTGLTFAGFSGWTTNVFNGIALLTAVALSTYLGRRRKRG